MWWPGKKRREKEKAKAERNEVSSEGPIEAGQTPGMTPEEVLREYKAEAGARYVVGCDTSEGDINSDFSTVAVTPVGGKMEKEQLTIEKKQILWDQIHIRGECPNCNAKHSMLEGPHGGLAVNIKCTVCGQKYWTTSFRGFGAEPI